MVTPLAFMSYAHRDNKDGYLTQLRQRLSEAVGMQIGEDFEIFQDENSIEWGQRWEQRIEQSLDEVTFLIPIVTPSFFRSEHCREEFRQFLDREKQLKRNDLILPIYYVDSRDLNDKERRKANEMAEQIHAHQYADWRELKHEPFTNRDIRRRLEGLATRIRDVLEQVEGSEETSDQVHATETQQPTAEEVPSRPQPSVSASEAGDTSSEPVTRTASRRRSR